MTSFFLFFLSILFYLPRVSPSLYGGDSGELIASSHLLGIAHAPGYPVYSLLGKAAQILIPWGNVSLRSNYLSALMAAGFLTLFFNYLRTALGGKKFSAAALLSVIFLGTTPFYVDQALSAEVFLLNLIFVTGILFSLQLAEDWSDPLFGSKWIWLAFFLWGVGLGNHHTLIVVSPLLLWSALRRKLSLSGWMGSVLFFLLGLSVYLYLPVRAAANPPVNFGDPQTLSRFWAVFSRQEFGTLSLHPSAVPFRDGPLVLAQLRQFGMRTLSQLGWWGLAAAIGGLVVGLISSRLRKLTMIGFVGWLGAGLGFELFSNLSPGSDIGQWRLERFFLIPLFSLSLMMAVFMSWLWERGKWVWLTGTIFGALILFESIASALKGPNLRDNYLYRDWAVSLMRSAPPSCALVIDSVLFDEPTSSVLVYTEVEGKRPDIQFYYRPGTLFEPVYGTDFLDLTREERGNRQRDVESVLHNSTSPVRFLVFEKAHTFFKTPRLDGLLMRDAEGIKSFNSDRGMFFVNRGVPGAFYSDYPRRLMGVHWLYFEGKRQLEGGDVLAADRWLASALQWGRPMAWLASNIGGLYAQESQKSPALLEKAQISYLKAINWDPYFSPGYFGLGYVAIRENNFETAVAAFEQAVRMDPHVPDSYYMLGVAQVMAGHPEKARGPWERYLQLAPSGTQADTVRMHLSQ